MTSRLWIEAPGEFGRAHEIAEHHGQLTALGLGQRGYLAQCRRPWDIGQDGTERGDGAEQSAAVADRCHAERLQILARQPAQNLLVNVVVAERGQISFEPEAAQPFGHIHRNCIGTASLRIHYNPNTASVQVAGWSSCVSRKVGDRPGGPDPI
jgi:hypothetical protein